MSKGWQMSKGEQAQLESIQGLWKSQAGCREEEEIKSQGEVREE